MYDNHTTSDDPAQLAPLCVRAHTHTHTHTHNVSSHNALWRSFNNTKVYLYRKKRLPSGHFSSGKCVPQTSVSPSSVAPPCCRYSAAPRHAQQDPQEYKGSHPPHVWVLTRLLSHTHTHTHTLALRHKHMHFQRHTHTHTHTEKENSIINANKKQKQKTRQGRGLVFSFRYFPGGSCGSGGGGGEHL